MMRMYTLSSKRVRVDKTMRVEIVSQGCALLIPKFEEYHVS